MQIREPFQYRTRLALADTDAAGVLFFARQFDLIHLAYETWMRQSGVGLDRMLTECDYFVSIVHAESDYCQPVRYAAEIVISLVVESIGVSSYVVAYMLHDAAGDLLGRAQTVHVCVDKLARTKRALPDELRHAVAAYGAVAGSVSRSDFK